MAGKQGEWSDERNAELRRRRDAGETTAVIARALGCSPNAIVGKAYRLGLSAKPSPIKTIAMEDRRGIVSAGKARASPEEIAKRFSVHIATVGKVLRAAGVKPVDHRLVPFNRRKARKLRAAGATYQAIGKVLGVSAKTVWRRLNARRAAPHKGTLAANPEGLPRRPGPPCLPFDLAKAFELRAAGASWRVIGKECGGVSGVTAYSRVTGRISKERGAA
jgi:hypothetical protein